MFADTHANTLTHGLKNGPPSNLDARSGAVRLPAHVIFGDVWYPHTDAHTAC